MLPVPSFDTLFSWAGALALVGWLCLLAARWLPAGAARTVRGIAAVVPVLLALGYVALLVARAGAVEGGGFGSIAQVRALFADDGVLLAGWVHYLAFDLFVGTRIERDADRTALPYLLLVPTLALCFLAGPAGLLMHAAVQTARGRAAGLLSGGSPKRAA